MAILKAGLRVRLRPVDTKEWVEGLVELASSNGRAILVCFEGTIRGRLGTYYIGGIPLLVDYDAKTVSSVTGEDYELEMLT